MKKFILLFMVVLTIITITAPAYAWDEPDNDFYLVYDYDVVDIKEHDDFDAVEVILNIYDIDLQPDIWIYTNDLVYAGRYYLNDVLIDFAGVYLTDLDRINLYNFTFKRIDYLSYAEVSRVWTVSVWGQYYDWVAELSPSEKNVFNQQFYDSFGIYILNALIITDAQPWEMLPNVLEEERQIWYTRGRNDAYNDALNESREYFGINYNGNWLTAEQWGDIRFGEGYNSGLSTEIDWWSWSMTLFLMPFRILNIEILPGIRIGYFALFSLLLGVVGWFFFIVGKGGGRRK